ncbi:MAG: hypothetical protein R3C56_01835 [Pirellulaceae bacterium]
MSILTPASPHQVIRNPQGQASLIRLAQQTSPGLLVTASGLGDGQVDTQVAEACDFLTPHWNGTKGEQIALRVAWLKRFGKPIVCNEDDKTGRQAVAAMHATVGSGASYGLMLQAHNQTFPFHFDSAADDHQFYAALKDLTSGTAPQPAETNSDSLAPSARHTQLLSSTGIARWLARGRVGRRNRNVGWHGPKQNC